MSAVRTIATVSPPYRYSTEDVRRLSLGWLGTDADQRLLFERLLSTTQIDYRSFALPLEEVVRLTGAEKRAEVFTRVGGNLLREAVSAALGKATLSPEEIGQVVYTSCSVPTIPALDAAVLPSMGFKPDTLRVPLFQHGCVGGAVGLSIAARLTKERPSLVVSVELCCLVHQNGDHTGGNVVGAAIFGDGAACAVVTPGPDVLRIVATSSHLIPESYHLMGYSLLDDGQHLKLDREVPSCLAEAAPQAIKAFLSSQGLTSADVRWWLFHPGGARILETLEDKLSLTRDCTHWSWDTLRDHGNMSSASILYVLEKFMADRPWVVGDRGLVLGVGPGLTLEMVLLECQ